MHTASPHAACRQETSTTVRVPLCFLGCRFAPADRMVAEAAAQLAIEPDANFVVCEVTGLTKGSVFEHYYLEAGSRQFASNHTTCCTGSDHHEIHWFVMTVVGSSLRLATRALHGSLAFCSSCAS